jgi:hypothetical protein
MDGSSVAHHRFARKLVATLAAFAFAAAGLLSFSTSSASAFTCNNVQQYVHVLGDKSPLFNLAGLQASVTYVNPFVCSYVQPPNPRDGFSTQNFTVCTASCAFWVQTGYWKKWSTGVVEAICEFTGPSGYHQIDLHSISAATHPYQIDRVIIFGISGWGCFLDGSLWTSRPDSTMGFSIGSSMTIQGETDAAFSQIGAVSPSKTTFSSLNYHVGANWVPLTPVCQATDSHYGHSCAAGQYQDWTN